MRSQSKDRAAWRWGQIGAASMSLLMGAGALVSAEVPRFDGRGWTAGHQQQNEVRSIIEYVLPGQTVENWKELVTSVVFFQPVPVAPFVEKLHASLAQGCPSLVWNVISQDEKTAIYEWRDSGCGGFEASSELARVTIEKDGLYRLAYTVKGRFRADRRKEWLAILGQAPLAEGPARGTARPEGPAPQDTDEEAALRAKVAAVLQARVREMGWPCSTATNVETRGQMPGPRGPLTQWRLECSDGVRYTVLVDPSGGMTAFRAPR